MASKTTARNTPVLPRRARAFTLIEAMVVLTVLSIVGVGVAVGLQGAIHVPEANDRALSISSELTSEMDNWRANAFGASPWPTVFPYSLTDTVTLTIGGKSLTYARTTTIKLWDPNHMTSNNSPQTDFAQVQITINGQVATCYFTKPV